MTSKLTDIEHSIETKSFWTFSPDPVVIKTQVVEHGAAGDRFVPATLEYSPAALSVIEELLINVLDQQVRRYIAALHITMDAESGCCTVLNYGDGFNVVQHPHLSRPSPAGPQPLWVPFFLSVFPFQGEQTTPPPNSVTGGVNGVGLKCVTRGSVFFELFTVDSKTGRCYMVRFEHRGRAWILGRSDAVLAASKTFDVSMLPFENIQERCFVIGAAGSPMDITIGGKKIILDRTKPFTAIRMLPRYSDRFKMTREMVADLTRAVEKRLYDLGTILRCPIFFNERQLPLSGGPAALPAFMKMLHESDKSWITSLDPEAWGCEITEFDQSRRWQIIEDPALHRFPLRIGVVLRRDHSGGVNWGCFNGVVVTRGGFFDYFRAQIVAAAGTGVGTTADSLDSKSFAGFVNGCLSLYIVGFVPRPNWESQTKNGSGFTLTRQGEYLKPFVLPKAGFLDPLVKCLREAICSIRDLNLIAEAKREIAAGSSEKTVSALTDFRPSPYAKANVAWSTRSKIWAFCSEGSSAYKSLNVALYGDSIPVPKDYIMHMAMRGVPMNARQNVLLETQKDGRIVRLPTPHLARNRVWNAFVRIHGLDYYKTYETDAEFQTLLAGRLIIATDQDVDGEGKITSLVLNYVDEFWPVLFRRGWVKHEYAARMMTDRPELLAGSLDRARALLGETAAADLPRLRSTALQLKAADMMSNWGLLSKIKKEYFKGLGSHTEQMIKHMLNADNFADNIVTFTYDERAGAYFEAFFEDKSTPRKDLLRGAAEGSTETADYVTDGTLSCSDHLLVAYAEFCREDHQRKLSHIISGMNNVKTRVLYGAIIHFAGKRDSLEKTDTLFASIAAATAYHHGANLMIDVINGCAKLFFGGKRFPFFLPFGAFGSRYDPVPAQARYIQVKPNWPVIEVLYPMLLPFRFENGVRTVPEYFCPLVPPLFEWTKIPSHGWCIEVQAIDIRDLIAVTRGILAGQSVREFPLRFDTKGWRGHMRTIEGSILTFGNCEVSGGVCVVTELPMAMTGVHFEEKLRSLGIEVVNGKEMYKEHPFIPRFGESSIISHSSQLMDTPDEIYIKFAIDMTKFAGLQKSRFKTTELSGKEAFMHSIGLTQVVGHELNFVGLDGRVLELQTYYDVIDHWLPVRKGLYAARVLRELTRAILRRAYLLSIELFCDWSGKAEIQSGSVLPAEAEQRFARASFFRFASSLITRPEHLSGQSLVLMSTGFHSLEAFEDAWAAKSAAIGVEGAVELDDETEESAGADSKPSYRYLHSLRFSAAYDSARKARQKEIEGLSTRIDFLRRPDAWSSLWSGELDAFEKICNENLPTRWTHLTKIKIPAAKKRTSVKSEKK